MPVTAAIVYLLSPSSGFVSGANIPVTGRRLTGLALLEAVEDLR